MPIDAIKYEIYTRGDHAIILYDKLEETFAIHSKDEDNHIAIIGGFKTAAQAMTFADDRVVSLEEDSRKKK